MRLDKFLQVSRLVRRRALANSLCHAGRVTVNGRAAAPAAAVRRGDVIAFEAAGRRVRARVVALPETGRRADTPEYVDILEQTTAE